MTTHSISAYNLPNRLDWSEFSELSFAHRIIQEHYLEGELEGCSIDTERGAYANTRAASNGWHHSDERQYSVPCRIRKISCA